MTTESRPRQTKLRWWDRFQTADGWIAATARTIVALTVVGSVIALGIVLTIPEAARAPVLSFPRPRLRRCLAGA
jgi:hypothetical protein